MSGRPAGQTAPAHPYDVLVVEDEETLANSLVEYLDAMGLSARQADSAEQALEVLAGPGARVVLLDVNLPGMSGFAMCRQLRSGDGPAREVPIIFTSARDADEDQILALSLGGDDYVRKPYSLAVLHARVRRALDRLASAPSRPTGRTLADGADSVEGAHGAHRAHREPGGDAGSQGYDDGWLRWDPVADRFWVDGTEARLPAMEHRLLTYLIEHQEQVVTKAALFAHVWGEAITGDGTLTVHVRRLRTRIEPNPASPRYVRTVWGRGYLFADQRTG